RREDILRAGLDLFVKKGYTATKIKDIADQVGMSLGLLFHYFPSKEELYCALVEYGISGPMNAVAPSGLDPIAFFEVTAEQVLAYIREDSFVARMFLFMNQSFMSEDVPQKAKERLKSFDVYTPTAALIRLGQQNGSIRDGDPLSLAAAFWSAISGMAELCAGYPNIPAPKSEWIVDIIRNHKA
ncbi:MAG: TetR/AcrR family transcriptional regulator, partial [Clostridiaceae bacterium]